LSQQNTRVAKRQRSIERAARKQEAARRINHLGVRVGRHIVESQRYLCDTGLPFSSRVAAVLLPRKAFRPAL
jgi:hypothetical protein